MENDVGGDCVGWGCPHRVVPCCGVEDQEEEGVRRERVDATKRLLLENLHNCGYSV